MGQCGCGDFRADYRFPGPDGHTYILHIYPSCNYCDTPAGVIIYKFDQRLLRLWGCEDLPETTISEDGEYIRILDPQILAKKMLEFPQEDYEIEGFVKDSLDEAFREAIFATREKESTP